MSSQTFLPDDLRAVASEVASLLKERNETISVAETVSALNSWIVRAKTE